MSRLTRICPNCPLSLRRNVLSSYHWKVALIGYYHQLAFRGYLFPAFRIIPPINLCCCFLFYISIFCACISISSCRKTFDFSPLEVLCLLLAASEAYLQENSRPPFYRRFRHHFHRRKNAFSQSSNVYAGRAQVPCLQIFLLCHNGQQGLRHYRFCRRPSWRW